MSSANRGPTPRRRRTSDTDDLFDERTLLPLILLRVVLEILSELSQRRSRKVDAILSIREFDIILLASYRRALFLRQSEAVTVDLMLFKVQRLCGSFVLATTKIGREVTHLVVRFETKRFGDLGMLLVKLIADRGEVVFDLGEILVVLGFDDIVVTVRPCSKGAGHHGRSERRRTCRAL